MSRIARARVFRPAVLLIGTVLALAGCSAGQITQTSTQVAGVNGVSARVGDIAVVNAQVEFVGPTREGPAYPRGSNAPLRMTIVNEGAALDRLVSVSGPVAMSVFILGDGQLPAGHALSVGNASDSTAVPLRTVRKIQVILFDVTQDLKPGGITYQVVLRFERAGELRVELPVGNPAEGAAGPGRSG